eukprot:CAMPEP_0118975514 /NCGR_PEP_ID=MMETSP1173-20130426/16023_1 /TAXON_ID=1034831 /ORGANISM="Rhizochromulina marina cf, Strain CCMP1243" /LENGTH=487 /DNA_ID=CAMNT_0006925409 /DNA_START=35 /DNA_END=1498 /DNA_ORIENTATION=-
MKRLDEEVSGVDPLVWNTTGDGQGSGASARRGLSALPSKDAHLVTSLPGLSPSAFPHKHWAGHIEVDSKHGGSLFYWLFEAAEDADTAPLVVWMNGGPACSSMDGLFLENGPFRLNADSSIAVNPYSWHQKAHLLYIDQPVGTGLSYTQGHVYPKNDAQVNLHLLAFFDAFYAVHDHLVGLPLFLSGESHAGHYLPSLGQAIMKRRSQRDTTPIQLGGLLIGNGWFDPRTQYDVSDFAHALGVISESQVRTQKVKQAKCHSKLDKGTYLSSECWDLLDDVIKASGVTGKQKMLMYDARVYTKSTSSFPPNHQRVEKYLNRKDVREALHATACNIQFKECTDPPYLALKHQDGLGVTQELEYLLGEDLPVLFYTGQYDIICNHLGVDKALQNLNWPHAKEFRDAQPSVWWSENVAGYVRTGGSLTAVLVLGAGHMVPMDQPAHALNLLNRFIAKNHIGDYKQSIQPTPPLKKKAGALHSRRDRDVRGE